MRGPEPSSCEADGGPVLLDQLARGLSIGNRFSRFNRKLTIRWTLSFGYACALDSLAIV